MTLVPDLDRARGVLWGQAVGDAIGTTQEFESPRDRRPFPELNAKPQDGLWGGGPFGLEPGQVTDDTHMAVCLAESLADRGAYDAADAARRYVKWSKVSFDVGRQTSATLGQIAKGVAPGEAGFAVWEAARRDPSANGSLMRCSPISVFFARDPAAARRAALEDSAITHADPRCRLACAAFTAAILDALLSPAANPQSMREAARAELEVAARAIEPRTPPELVTKAQELLREDLDLAGKDDPLLLVAGSGVHLHHQAGYVRVAFRLAFWELVHAPTFAAAVLDCANRGGDADTNAAIAGALVGALAGERGIPEEWRRKVEGACQGDKHRRTPWAERYHPRKLFRVLGA